MRRALEFFCAIASRCSKQMVERENLREYEVARLWMLSPLLHQSSIMTSIVKIYLIDGTDELFRPRRFARHRGRPDAYYVTDDYPGYSVGQVSSRQPRCVARSARHGLQVCNPQSRTPFVRTDAPLTKRPSRAAMLGN